MSNGGERGSQNLAGVCPVSSESCCWWVLHQYRFGNEFLVIANNAYFLREGKRWKIISAARMADVLGAS